MLVHRIQGYRSSSETLTRCGAARRSRTDAIKASSSSVIRTGLKGNCPGSATYCKASRISSEEVTPSFSSSRYARALRSSSIRALNGKRSMPIDAGFDSAKRHKQMIYLYLQIGVRQIFHRLPDPQKT